MGTHVLAAGCPGEREAGSGNENTDRLDSRFPSVVTAKKGRELDEIREAGSLGSSRYRWEEKG